MNEVLQLGGSGDQVKILQAKLKQLGFYSALITGEFSLATEEGVKAFQRELNLEPTGVVDQEVWEKLIEYTEPAIAPISLEPTLSYGSSGQEVRTLQTKLKALLYYTGDINGNFDLETQNAVKRFQLNNSLTATGIANDQTWDAINFLYGNLASCAIDEETGEDKDEDKDEYPTATYKVVSGDTLYAIAKRFNTTVDAIKSLNGLTTNTLQVGQVLRIPDQEDYKSYVVANGDTLYSIARRFNTTVDAIKSLNGLTTNTLQVGQVLRIPDQESDDYMSYVVINGDTLYSIARRFNTTVDTIKELNGLTSNTLSIGQVLKIPTNNETSSIFYTVEKNDTLYSIARRFNTTVDAIKNLNGLTSNILDIGQVLKIPV